MAERGTELELLADLEARLNAAIPAFRWSAEINLKLERIDSLLQRLGRPERAYPVVHVGGTSGKGSVAASIASALSHGGSRVGLHLSPYVQTLTETWQLDGRHLLPSRVLPTAIDVIAAASEISADLPFGPVSYFETKVAIAFKLFAEEAVDAAVIEVGLGGTRDATNVVRPRVSVLTNVGLDHTEILGDTVEQIAADKAGIIKPGSVVVSGVTQPTVKSIIRRRAADVGARAMIVGDDIRFRSAGSRLTVAWADRECAVDIQGDWTGFQMQNAVLAIVAALEFNPRLRPAEVSAGLAAVRLPARFERFSESGRSIVLDGAHNADKVCATAAAIAQRFPDAKRVAVVALKDTKDARSILAALTPLFGSFVLTTFSAGLWHAAPPEELASCLAALGYGGGVTVQPDPALAVEAALAATPAGGLLAVIGSFYLAGNVRGRWVPPLTDVLRGGAYDLGAQVRR